MSLGNYWSLVHIKRSDQLLASQQVSWRKLLTILVKQAIMVIQGGVTPQSSVLPPTIAVKHKVKGQEANMVEVKGKV